MKYDELLEELKALKLDINDYAIFGSGPLAVRNLRESNDIDLIVTEKLWDKLVKKYSIHNNKIIIGDVEIWQDWKPWIDDTEALIRDAELIKGTPHVKLKYVKEWKKKMGRKKDLEDIKLIEENSQK